MNNVIECNGFKARIMEADRLVGSQSFELPPGIPLPIYKVSSFKKRPDNWMVDEGSVVVPVKSDKGLWFDWTLNDAENTAVLASVKGCNPLTGELINGFRLESYKHTCPVHGTKLDDKLYCSDCGFEWVPQNYICGPNYLWNDGWRDKDGTVRQFFFTEDMARDIASHKLGEENTVPAFGFAFFTPKEKHLSVKYDINTGIFSPVNPSRGKMTVIKGFPESSTIESIVRSRGISVAKSGTTLQNTSTTTAYISTLANYTSTTTNQFPKTEAFYCSNVVSNNTSINCLFEDANYSSKIVETKDVAVGAGAVIKQSIKEDKYGIDTWKDAPDAVMRIYFVFQDEFDKWASHGFVGENGSMLSGLPIG